MGWCWLAGWLACVACLCYSPALLLLLDPLQPWSGSALKGSILLECQPCLTSNPSDQVEQQAGPQGRVPSPHPTPPSPTHPACVCLCFLPLIQFCPLHNRSSAATSTTTPRLPPSTPARSARRSACPSGWTKVSMGGAPVGSYQRERLGERLGQRGGAVDAWSSQAGVPGHAQPPNPRSPAMHSTMLAVVCLPACVAGLYPEPPECALDNKFDLSNFQGRWYITGGWVAGWVGGRVGAARLPAWRRRLRPLLHCRALLVLAGVAPAERVMCHEAGHPGLTDQGPRCPALPRLLLLQLG